MTEQAYGIVLKFADLITKGNLNSKTKEIETTPVKSLSRDEVEAYNREVLKKEKFRLPDSVIEHNIKIYKNCVEMYR